MRKLAPCANCGENAAIRYRDENIFSNQTYTKYPGQLHGFKNRCEHCAMQTCWWHTQYQADKAWNRRPKRIGNMIDFTKPIRQKNGMRAVLLEQVDCPYPYIVAIQNGPIKRGWTTLYLDQNGNPPEGVQAVENIPEETQ